VKYTNYKAPHYAVFFSDSLDYVLLIDVLTYIYFFLTEYIGIMFQSLCRNNEKTTSMTVIVSKYNLFFEF